MACCILIIFYIHHELSYDRFHKNADRIYRVSMQGLINGEPMNIAYSPSPLAAYLRMKFPEVAGAAHIRKRGTHSIQAARDRIHRIGGCVRRLRPVRRFHVPDDSRRSQNGPGTPYTVVLTESTARKYFGSTDPIGKSLKFDNRTDYEVTGVLKDIPPNSHLRFGVICAMETWQAKDPNAREDWYSDITFYTYVRLKQSEDAQSLEKKFPALVDEKLGLMAKAMKAEMEFRLQPLADIHLQSKLQWEFGDNGDILYVYIFAAIALFILAIACINFMNLATARSARRAREVGMRKVVGAGRGEIFWQFIGESIGRQSAGARGRLGHRPAGSCPCSDPFRGSTWRSDRGIWPGSSRCFSPWSLLSGSPPEAIRPFIFRPFSRSRP